MRHQQSKTEKSESKHRTRKINYEAGQNNNNKQNLYMVVPYHQGLSQRVKKSCNKFGVQVYFKGGQTIRSLLMAWKDKDPITNKSGVIYRYKCNENGCEEEYIGESARTFAERFKEHQKAPSPIYDHCNISDHKLNINNFTIVGREDQNLTRAIKEALFIRVNDPSLNRNIGKYHLPHIWDKVLHKTSELKLKHWPSGHSICHFGYNICQTTPIVGIPSATLAVTSAKHELSSTVAVTPATWQQHLPNISIQYMNGCFSFCCLVCKSNILSNRTNIFRDKTSFRQFLTWLLPGLKKMLILIISNTEGVKVLEYPAIFGQ